MLPLSPGGRARYCVRAAEPMETAPIRAASGIRGAPGVTRPIHGAEGHMAAVSRSTLRETGGLIQLVFGSTLI
jgi:hypothetical protein